MSYVISDFNKENLIKKLIRKFEQLKVFNSNNIDNGWSYVCEQDYNDIINTMKKNHKGEYSITLFITQVPNYQINYHGICK